MPIIDRVFKCEKVTRRDSGRYHCEDIVLRDATMRAIGITSLVGADAKFSEGHEYRLTVAGHNVIEPDRDDAVIPAQEDVMASNKANHEQLEAWIAATINGDAEAEQHLRDAFARVGAAAPRDSLVKMWRFISDEIWRDADRAKLEES